MPSRRSVLRTMSAATAFAAAPMAAYGKTIGGTTHAPPWWLLGSLEPGTSLGGGWTLRDLGPIHEGSSVIELLHDKQGRLRIHLCLHEGNPKGFAHSALFDLIVIDQGRGVRPVPDDLAPALLALEQTIRDNELASTSAFDHVADMMTHKERVDAFGAGQIQ